MAKEVFDTKETRDALVAMMERVRLAAFKIAKDGAHIVQASAMAELHVGYGVRTGALRRSIKVSGPYDETQDRVYALVGPTMVYSRRQELGFVGPDSIGRVFPYRPRPYMKPGTEKAKHLLNELAEKRWAEATKG